MKTFDTLDPQNSQPQFNILTCSSIWIYTLFFYCNFVFCCTPEKNSFSNVCSYVYPDQMNKKINELLSPTLECSKDEKSGPGLTICDELKKFDEASNPMFFNEQWDSLSVDDLASALATYSSLNIDLANKINQANEDQKNNSVNTKEVFKKILLTPTVSNLIASGCKISKAGQDYFSSILTDLKGPTPPPSEQRIPIDHLLPGDPNAANVSSLLLGISSLGIGVASILLLDQALLSTVSAIVLDSISKAKNSTGSDARQREIFDNIVKNELKKRIKTTNNEIAETAQNLKNAVEGDIKDKLKDAATDKAKDTAKRVENEVGDKITGRVKEETASIRNELLNSHAQNGIHKIGEGFDQVSSGLSQIPDISSGVQLITKGMSHLSHIVIGNGSALKQQSEIQKNLAFQNAVHGVLREKLNKLNNLGNMKSYCRHLDERMNALGKEIDISQRDNELSTILNTTRIQARNGLNYPAYNFRDIFQKDKVKAEQKCSCAIALQKKTELRFIKKSLNVNEKFGKHFLDKNKKLSWRQTLNAIVNGARKVTGAGQPNDNTKQKLITLNHYILSTSAHLGGLQPICASLNKSLHLSNNCEFIEEPVINVSAEEEKLKLKLDQLAQQDKDCSSTLDLARDEAIKFGDEVNRTLVHLVNQNNLDWTDKLFEIYDLFEKWKDLHREYEAFKEALDGKSENYLTEVTKLQDQIILKLNSLTQSISSEQSAAKKRANKNLLYFSTTC